MESNEDNTAHANVTEPLEKEADMAPKRKRRDPIIKNHTRILVPEELYWLLEELNPVYAAIILVLIHTGMRVTEFWDFVDHPSWYKPSRHCISLPKGAIKKDKCVYKERDIILTEEGCKCVETLLGMSNIKKVSRTAMREAMMLAAEKTIGSQGVSPKSCRKTAISWLVRINQDKHLYIASSAGHTLETMKINYLGIAFKKEDIESMRIFFKGWGE